MHLSAACPGVDPRDIPGLKTIFARSLQPKVNYARGYRATFLDQNGFNPFPPACLFSTSVPSFSVKTETSLSSFIASFLFDVSNQTKQNIQ